MSFETELPRAMKARLARAAEAAIGRQILTGDDPIKRRIEQPKDKDFAGHIVEIRDWLDAWQREEVVNPGLRLATTRKRSSGLSLSLPSSITFERLEDYARWLGVWPALERALARLEALRGLDARLFEMARQWSGLAAWNDLEFEAFQSLLDWRISFPESRPAVRAMAIPGIDTKWIENNRTMVRAAFRLVDAYDETAESDLERLGFDTTDRMTVWFRAGSKVGGLGGMVPQVGLRPSDAHRGLFPNATRVIVIENQTSFERLDLGSGDLAIFGQGAQAPGALAAMPWLSEIECLLYWGDMDGEGYRILARSRRAHGRLTSVLMGVGDAERHLDRLSVSIEPDCRPAPPELTPDEAEAYARLAGPGRRIEQEWIPLEDVVAALGRERETA